MTNPLAIPEGRTEAEALSIGIDRLVHLSKLMGIPDLMLLPLKVDYSDRPGPLAYTNKDAIWVKQVFLMAQPHHLDIVVGHEIGHHIFHRPEDTMAFSHDIVNRAEDYQINEWLFATFGLDIRKLGIGALFNRRLGRLPLPTICKRLVKTPEDVKGCGCMGVSHPVLQDIAERLRKRFNVNLEANAIPISHDITDTRLYNQHVDALRKEAFAPAKQWLDVRRWAKALWLMAHQSRPAPIKPYTGPLTVEQTLLFGWHADHVRHKTVGDGSASSVAVLTWINNLHLYDNYLWQKLAEAENALDNIHMGIKVAKARKRKALSKGRAKRYRKLGNKIKKLRERIPAVEKRIARRKEEMEWPLPRLLEELPVRGLHMKRTDKSSTLSLANYFAQDTESDSLVNLPRLRYNRTVKVLKLISRLASHDFEHLTDLMAKFGKSFNDWTTAEQAEQEIDGGSEGQSSIDTPATPPPWAQILAMNAPDREFLQNLMKWMKFFETQIKINPKVDTDPNSAAPGVLPHMGNELDRIDPAEFALLANPETEMLFYSKLSDGTLSIRVPRRRKRQPVIMSIDCSGSMNSQRYAAACGFALAMGKLLQRDGRGWGIQLFTTRVVSSMIVDGVSPSIGAILNFLMARTSGGTSFNASVTGMLNARDSKNWTSASMVTISDGEGDISPGDELIIRPRLGPEDKLTAIVVTGHKMRLGSLPIDLYRLKKEGLVQALVKVGQEMLG